MNAAALAGVDMAPPADRTVFAYVGRTALTVTGSATGRQYRFTAPGALATVDCRDAPSLRQVAQLRRVVLAA